MTYKSYKAPTYKDAVIQAKMDLGSDFYIIGRKETREGGVLGLFRKSFTEITVARNEEDAGCPPGRPVKAPGSRVDAPPPRKTVPATRAAPDSAPAGDAKAAGGAPGVGLPDPPRGFSESSIIKELHEIRKRLEVLRPEERERTKSPHLDRIVSGLRENDFSEDFIDGVRARLETELTLKDASDPRLLEARLKAHMLESIETAGPIQIGKGKPSIVVLVGPTGVGKTTTIAKLAASYGIMQKHKVEVFTIDSYRIAAIEQLGKYAELMQLPFTVINTREEFKNSALNSKADLIFVDTAGRSPRNSLGLAELRGVLDGVRSGLDIHLVVSATTKYRDAVDIFTRFNQLVYNKVIITKLDEAVTIGPLVSALGRERQVSYLTTGQSVPDDIELAAKEKLLDMVVLDEFAVS
jgi:flagellar biosynthesis protein FlhF